MAAAAFAQQAQQAAAAPPLRQFVLRLETVRPGTTFENLTLDERKITQQHGAYLYKLYSEGKLTYGGQIFDPKGLAGFLVVNAPDLDAATAMMKADPGYQANFFRGDVVPFRTVFNRPPEPASTKPQ